MIKNHKLFVYILFVSVPIIIINGCSKRNGDYSGPLNSFKRYPQKQFHIRYEYSGGMRGEDNIYVSDYGKYEARYSKFDILTGEVIQRMENGSLTRISDVYDFDNHEKTITHTHSTSLDSLYHLDAKDIPTPQDYQDSEMTKNLLRKTGTEIIDGKPAIKWSMPDGSVTLWFWNSVLLRKHIITKEGDLDVNIKSIDSLWTVDTSIFSIPVGFINKVK